MEKKRLKILLTLFVSIVVLIFITISLSNFSREKLDIQKRIGNVISSNNLTMREYTTISENTIGRYLHFLQNKEYNNAYLMLSPYYKEIVSSDVFIQKMEEIDFSDYHITQIVHETDNMYVVDVQLNDKIDRMLVMIEDKGFCIVPEPFLKYFSTNQKITKNGIQYELIGYQVNIDNCIFDVKIANNSNKDAIIESNMLLASGYSISAENKEILIDAGKTDNFSITFSTHIDFPSIFQIVRKDEKKERIYEFKLD